MNTMKKYNSKLLSITGLALAGILFAASPVQADCDKFPTVPWWGNLDHERVASFVSRKHDGDWNPYIEKWSKQVDKLKGVHKRESSVFVRYKGKKVKIAGDALKNYIKLVEKRVTVVKCLAQIANYANFATAAGKKKKNKTK